MLDTLRPKLKASVRLRRRADGSWGLADPVTGRALEIAPDQDTLVPLVDGERSIAQIADEHLKAYRFVPFAALRDLLRSLSANGLLSNPREDLEKAKLPTRATWMTRLSSVSLVSVPIPASRILSGLLLVAVAACAVLGARLPGRELTPWDVPLALAGVALGLSLRGWVKAAVAGVLGPPPFRMHLATTFWIPHLTLDHSAAVLLERWPRSVSHVWALAGAGAAVALGASVPGLAFGALVVLLADLCPFAPTSFGKLLATLAGRVDLREHARAYLSRRLLRRMGSSRFFTGEASLIASALLSLAWLALVVRLLLTRGVVLVIELAGLGMDEAPLPQALAFLGAGVVALALPVSLVALVAAVVRAVAALAPHRPARTGTEVRSSLATADLAAIPLFSRVPEAELSAIAAAAQEIRFAPGEPIVVQGAPGDAFFAIRSGEVAVEHEEESGLIREVARLGAGDCFGEVALLDRKPRSATVRAIRETVALKLSADAFDRVRRSAGDGDVTAVLRATAALHRSTLFGSLTPDRLSSLALKLTPRSISAGNTVVQEGEPGHEFFLVGSGKLEVLAADGKRVGELAPGDHFGEIALLRDVPRTATVRAVDASMVLVLDKEAFIAALASDLSLSVRVEELAGERAKARG